MAITTSGFAEPPATPEKSSARSLSLKRVDGGREYYGKFSRALPTRSSYFPIGTWLQTALSPSEVAEDREAGLNLYVGVADPEGSDLGLLRANGMKRVDPGG